MLLLTRKPNLVAETCTAQCLHKDRAMCLQGSCLQQLRAVGQASVIGSCTPENTAEEFLSSATLIDRKHFQVPIM